jgi:hypothetical protein
MRVAFSGSFRSASRLLSLGFGQDDTGLRVLVSGQRFLGYEQIAIAKQQRAIGN